jgi:hypothetical protein
MQRTVEQNEVPVSFGGTMLSPGVPRSEGGSVTSSPAVRSVGDVSWVFASGSTSTVVPPQPSARVAAVHAATHIER